MADVVLEAVSKIYPGPVTAVRDFSLAVRDREFMVFVGPSGCGKSTTLRMIAGLETVSAGTISIGGRVVNDLPPKHRDIAMVFQNYALYPHMTVRENMAFGLRLRKVPRADIARRVAEAAAILGLQEYLDRRPKALSGGQRQRVALGRAIVRQPKAFLFDEPLSNLDAKMRVQMRAELRALHARLEATMIYVTHDQVEAMTLGDRIAVLNDGVIQQTAAPLELYDQPATLFVAGFIGTPPMNLVRGALRGAGAGLRFEAPPLSLPVTGPARARLAPCLDTPAVLGIRPEHLALAADAPGAPTVRARIEMIEPLGASTHLHLAAGPHAFIAAADPHRRHALGETVELAFRPDRLRFFDAASGRRMV